MKRLDLIIECMEQILNDELPSPENMMTAFRYACELRELKPVAFSYVSNFYKTDGEKMFIDSPDKILMAQNLKYALTPLYALDEVTK